MDVCICMYMYDMYVCMYVCMYRQFEGQILGLQYGGCNCVIVNFCIVVVVVVVEWWYVFGGGGGGYGG